MSFFDLPQKVRMLIYEHALVLDEELYFDMRAERRIPHRGPQIKYFYHFRKKNEVISTCENIPLMRGAITKSALFSYKERDPYSFLSPSILATCKAISKEAGSLLYSRNSISFVKFEDVCTFLTTIGKDNAALLTTLSVVTNPRNQSDYSTAVTALGRLGQECPNLRTLRLWGHLYVGAAGINSPKWDTLVRLIDKITSVETLHLREFFEQIRRNADE
jgi:hypothetical protein